MTWFYRTPPREGIYQRIERQLGRYPQPMEDDDLARASAELDREFLAALLEIGADITGLRLELRRDDLLGVVPWVLHANGLEGTLSAFSAAGRRNVRPDF